MPLFMDFHRIDSDAVTEEDLYKAHLRDIAVQNKHGLVYIRYYLNLPQKSAFCLMEAPSREACIESHKEAHGAGACNVIEVSREHEFIPFMGEGDQNEHDLALTLSGEIDSGYRTILSVSFLDLEGRDDEIADEIIRCIKRNHGNVVKGPTDEIMSSFIHASDALKGSLGIKGYFESLPNKIPFSIGMATGKPVEEQGTEMFQETKRKVKVMSGLGYWLGICMDENTRLSALRNDDPPQLDATPIIVLDAPLYEEMEGLHTVLSENLGNAAFDTAGLSQELGLNRTQAYRKIYGLLGLPPMRLLSDLRLMHAARALKRGNKTVSEVAYDSGYNSPTYFTRVFRKRFDRLPTSIA